MLTTLPTVKLRLGISAFDVKDDVLLENFIALISARFENECNRLFGYKLNQVDEFQGDESELRVRRFPIDDAQPITFARLTKASEGWQAVTDAEYVLRKACVISLLSPIGRSQEQSRVTYSGGFFLPDMSLAIQQSNNPPPLPDDLQQACVEQVAYLYQNRERLGLVSVSAEAGNIQQFPALDLLPSVAAILAKYEAWMG
jgi:hypothetical protein